MAGMIINNVDFNGIRLSKGITVEEFNSWIVGTLGGSGSDSYLSSVEADDGGYVTVGSQDSQTNGDRDALIVKYDINLNVTNQKSIGGLNSDTFFDIKKTNDGGYIVVGGQASQSESALDAWIIKYDSGLNLVSQKTIGGPGTDYFYSVTQTSDGGYVAVGRQESQGQDSDNAFIVKYDSSLNTVTQKSIGGFGADFFRSVVELSNGDIIAVGYQRSDRVGVYDAMIVKFDSNLSIISQKGLQGSDGEYFLSISPTSDGRFIVTGYQDSQTQGLDDAMIIIYDSNLNLDYYHSLGGSGNERYQSGVETDDGGFLAVGVHSSQAQGTDSALIVKYDSNLNVVAQKSLGGSGSERFNSIIKTSTGYYIAVGEESSESLGNTKSLIVKFDDDLNLITGSITNHSDLSWNSVSLSSNNYNFSQTTTSFSLITVSLNTSTTTLLETTTNLTEIRSQDQ